MSTINPVNIWTTANDWTWDTLRAWFDKINTNFSNLNSNKSETTHNHAWVYAPVLWSDDNYVTDAEKTKLSNLSWTNTGDQTNITWNAWTVTNWVYLASTQTLTNKRITKRVVTVTQSATPSINTDNWDIFRITGLAQAITSMTTNLTWTPSEWDMVMIQITDNGTARAITWWASFSSWTNATLPTTTVISVMKKVLLQRIWSSWVCLAVD